MSRPPSTFVGTPAAVDLSDVRLPMWAVFDRPKDFPHAVIARLFECGRGSDPLPMNVIVAFENVEACHAAFAQLVHPGRKVANAWVWIPRSECDEPQIIGTYL